MEDGESPHLTNDFELSELPFGGSNNDDRVEMQNNPMHNLLAASSSSAPHEMEPLLLERLDTVEGETKAIKERLDELENRARV